MARLAALAASASLFMSLAGHTQAAVPEHGLTIPTSANDGGAKQAAPGIRLAGAPVPKITTPQVHVNVGTHAETPRIATPQIHATIGTHTNTGNAGAATGANVNRSSKIHSGKNKTVTAHRGTPHRKMSFAKVKVEYQPQSDNGGPVAKPVNGQK